MSGRPKLVEEGRALTSHDGMDVEHNANKNVSSSSKTDSAGGGGGGGGGGGSSLQRAASKVKASGVNTTKSIPKKTMRPKTSSSSNLYVIGGGEGQENPATIGLPTTSPRTSFTKVHEPSFTIGGGANIEVPANGNTQECSMDFQASAAGHTVAKPRTSSTSFHVVGNEQPENEKPTAQPVTYCRPRPRPQRSSHVQTSFVVGGGGEMEIDDSEASDVHEPVDRMEGIEDHGAKVPLVVLDGANVAYAYADAFSNLDHVRHHYMGRNKKPEPNPQGIKVAADYFLAADLRVLVVLPASWLRSKPRAGDANQDNPKMLTPQLELLNDLKSKGLLVSSPPTDDDDAYALTIALREDNRSKRRKGEGPGFVLSNDLFRDAMARDQSGSLKEWLNHGRSESNGPGRISFAFCDLGNIDDFGDQVLDFVPNPRHPLVIWTERHLTENDAI